MIDLQRQMREASGIGDQLTALAALIRAVDGGEISEVEAGILRKAFGETIGETMMRLEPIQ
ncbi:hypothetical protein [Thiobacillus denitrificans]|uniref:hypothetical protein n=1 Tax=Thiobacillus denitrificans TaxID=36861 RepID=UPI00035FDB42|nr:hypothetical protein [Thiobacillus denitrificans]